MGKDAYFAVKGLSKGLLTMEDMTTNAVIEKQILLMCDSPFIVRLYNTWQDEQFVYYVLEACMGGDLYRALRDHNLHGKLPCIQYYSAVVVTILTYLHKKKIIYRDLKPENFLLKSNGTLTMCDFGIAKVVIGNTYTFCGTPDYMAPETITQEGHGAAADWWAFGIFLHELITSRTPFDRCGDVMEVYRAISNGVDGDEFRWDELLENDHISFLRDLLEPTPSKRLPMRPNGIEELKHDYIYSGFEWQRMQSEQWSLSLVPFVPQEVNVAEMCGKIGTKLEAGENLTLGGWRG